MLTTMLKFEIKNVLRERMTMVMLVYPLLFGFLGRWLINSEIVSGDGIDLVAIFVSLLAGFAYGAMAGFSLLDDRDDQVLFSIQITPVSVQLYIWFKILFSCGLAVLAGFFVIWFTGAVDMAAGDILLVAAVSALQVPLVAFVVNAFAKNKVEGFVSMKATGFLLIFPIAGFFFLDAKEWLFAIAPAHWPAKAIQYALLEPAIEIGLVEMNLNFYQYVGLGAVYNLVLVGATYLLFKKKNLL